MAEPVRPSSSHDDPTTLAVRCVRALMERHGLPKYRQSAWLAGATRVSYAPGHRGMTGGAAWALEDIEQGASLFGESLADVVTMGRAHGAVPAVMRLGAATLPCELWIGDPV